MTTCDHDAIKAEPFRFVVELDQIGIMETTDDTLILGNCKVCKSTLAISVEEQR